MTNRRGRRKGSSSRLKQQNAHIFYTLDKTLHSHFLLTSSNCVIVQPILHKNQLKLKLHYLVGGSFLCSLLPIPQLNI